MITDDGAVGRMAAAPSVPRAPRYGRPVRTYLRPGFAVPYGLALAVFIVAVIFFGWAGFWLGLAVLVLVKVARWGLPLIKLSYAPAPTAGDREKS